MVWKKGSPDKEGLRGEKQLGTVWSSEVSGMGNEKGDKRGDEDGRCKNQIRSQGTGNKHRDIKRAGRARLLRWALIEKLREL
jgi:hypothetical protein